MSRETPRTDAAVTVCACGRVVSEHVAQGIERSLTAAEAERDKLRKRDAEWQEKAKAWMASPEAAKRLAGYREMAEKCADLDVALDTARAERDALRDKALRYDLDQAGILQREREAIELVDLRARVAGLEAGLLALANAADDVGVTHLDKEDLTDEGQAMLCATAAARALLAPSSEVKP